jgi:hypothetical protein
LNGSDVVDARASKETGVTEMKTESERADSAKETVRARREWQTPVLSKESATITSGKVLSSVEFAPDLGPTS